MWLMNGKVHSEFILTSWGLLKQPGKWPCGVAVSLFVYKCLFYVHIHMFAYRFAWSSCRRAVCVSTCGLIQLAINRRVILYYLPSSLWTEVKTSAVVLRPYPPSLFPTSLGCVCPVELLTVYWEEVISTLNQHQAENQHGLKAVNFYGVSHFPSKTKPQKNGKKYSVPRIKTVWPDQESGGAEWTSREQFHITELMVSPLRSYTYRPTEMTPKAHLCSTLQMYTDTDRALCPFLCTFCERL